MAIFVTGATGLVGGNLVQYLLEQKHIHLSSHEDLICLVRTPAKAIDLQSLGVKIIQGDLSDKEILSRIFQEYTVEFVFHLAACVSVHSSFDEMYRTNVLGTKNLLEAFCDSSAKTFIHTSSIIVYDHKNLRKRNKVIKFTEKSPIGAKEKGKDVPYAVTKRLAEDLVKKFAASYPSKSFLITRLGPIIGKGDRQMIPSLTHAFALPLPKLINHGKGQISLTAARDVARAQVFLVKNGNSYSGQAFNIAHEPWNFYQLFNIVAEYYQRPPPKFNIPLWLFLMFKPLLTFIRFCGQKSEFTQTILSPTALEYMEFSYEYVSEKIRNLGFKFTESVYSAVWEGLEAYDPRKLIPFGRNNKKLKSKMKKS
ncbi:MAG: hypothetical protein DRO88_14395 [Promethearchaeia archaeon]|nr:MAG: hypothetical protein DRO88_14395 [Candidatus Lokiarchaeia archaeon]